MLIRAEKGTDLREILAVNQAAFSSPDEANLVDELRTANTAVISLVAEENGLVLYHPLFDQFSV